MSKKNKGAVLFIVIGILSVLSWSIFTGSFILKDHYNKIFIEKNGDILEENKKIANSFYKIYMKNLENKNIEDIASYLLKKGEKEIWKENFGDSFSLTDSGYYIDEIYIMKKFQGIDTSFEKIYSKESGQKNNYFGIIKNFSSINRNNTIRIILKKDIKNFRIGDLEKYWVEIFGIVEIKYFFKGSKYPLENIEKSQGEINVKIFEKGDSNFKNK